MSLRQSRETGVQDEQKHRDLANIIDRGAASVAIARGIGDPQLILASRRINGRGKRVFDLMFGAAALAFVLPLIAALFVAARLGRRGPVFERMAMVGRRGRPFEQLRFRTSRRGFGRFLERSGLARLPSLLNVLAGQMSLVGAPPLNTDGVDALGTERRYYLCARPGLTAPWPEEHVRAANLHMLCRLYVLNWRLRADFAVVRAVLFDGSRPRFV